MKKYIVPTISVESLCSEDIMTLSGGLTVINDTAQFSAVENALSDGFWS